MFKFTTVEKTLFLLLLVFSVFIMWKTFYVTPDGNLQIAAKVWSDFAATIPLMRSFSLGTNFPPEYPIFSGPPIRYHFVYYLLVGSLEKIGFPLDWALNIPSALGFTLLLIAIYVLSKVVFKNRWVGVLSVIFFLFNGSFSFLEFFKSHSISPSIFAEVINNTSFSSFGPYDGKIVSAFWNLNIYTNQRHLAFSYASFLILVTFIYHYSLKPEKVSWLASIGLGVLIGLFPFIHFAVFAMIGMALTFSFLIYPKVRSKLFITGLVAFLVALPQVFYMGQSSIPIKLIKIGYLLNNPSLKDFVSYWFFNLGIVSLLAPIGFLISNKDQRKVFLLFIPFFILGNIFQLSPEIAANHKFFNMFLIGLNMFAAFLLVKIWGGNLLGKVVVSFLFPFLIISGVIDFFPIINDGKITLVDIPNNKTALFIKKNTAKEAVFLNAQFLYDPASLAGRKIYLGWPYFAWGAGYDTTKRYGVMKSILTANNLKLVCSLLSRENIDFIEIQNPTTLEDVSPNYRFFDKNFRKIFHDQKTNITIYDPASSCVTLS